jgi:uncharacterized protein YcbX
MTRTMSTIQSIYRYPVKGLSPEALMQTSLSSGETIAGDRIYAIENGPSGFDPSAPAFKSKNHFLMLMRNSRLAALQSRFDMNSHVLTLHCDARLAARGDLTTAEGRRAIEEFFARHCAGEMRGAPKVLYAPGHSFSDVAGKAVSIINLASVAAIEQLVGMPINPLRFRANIYIAGWPPWHERGLGGSEIALGPSARLKIVRLIERCAAIDVDPDTGIRDLSLPRELMQAFGNIDCGVYGEVVADGDIIVGDLVTTAQ